MRIIKRFFKLALFSLIALLTMLYFFQEKLIFHSTRIPQDHVYQFATEFDELFLTAADGAVLNGLHFKQPNPNGVILYCHGNAGELDDWGAWAQELSERYHYDVVIWDYRGYGKSTGKRRQNLMLDDGYLFYNYCKSQFPEDKITVFGRSLGGFFATHIALASKASQLILESTPTSLLNIAKREYPFLPSKQLLKFKFQNEGNITDIKMPTYIIHGTDDQLVPFEHGQQLYTLSQAQTKKLFAIDSGGHNDLHNFKDSYFNALDELFK
ncbi:alpha/beta hydrolase [Maribacter algicola]|uniref:Alpha/beta hydrolase n=1 Tax=Meishania litoralis TaxID=3434685 RepID=A0ACC7LK65_9FLAO